MTRVRLSNWKAFAGVSVLIGLCSTSAMGYNFGSGTDPLGGGSMYISNYDGDNTFEVTKQSLESANATGVNDHLNWVDVNLFAVSNNTSTSCSSTRDVCITDDNYGDSGYYGAEWCTAGSPTSGSHPNMRCRSASIYFNTYYIGYSNYNARRLSCHELGHALGLMHRPNTDTGSCMKQYVPTLVNTYDAHDIAHLDTAYPY